MSHLGFDSGAYTSRPLIIHTQHLSACCVLLRIPSMCTTLGRQLLHLRQLNRVGISGIRERVSKPPKVSQLESGRARIQV